MSDETTQAAASDTAPESAPQTPAKKTRFVWKCSVCGYIETRYPDGLPADYRCPICNAKPKKFKRIEVEM